jgi:hypothetical protein
MHRVAIIGGPRTGKTTKARGAACAGVEVCETDAWKGMAWSAQSERVVSWLVGHREDAFVIEGCMVVRGLRKYLRGHPGKPVDVVQVCETPREVLSRGQRRMQRGVETVFREIESELTARGVRIEREEAA